MAHGVARVERRVIFAAVALVVMTGVALVGYGNMPPEPSYFTVDRFGYTGIETVREVLPALAFGVAGLVAWHRRPTNRIGPLMVVIGLAILLKGVQGIPIPPVVSLGIWASIGPGLKAVLLGILILAYPTGSLSSRAARWWVASAMLYAATLQVAWALYTPTTRDSTRCFECFPAWILGYDEFVRLNLRNVSMLVFAALTILLILLIARRWLRASNPTRRVIAPVWLAGVAVVLVAVASPIVEFSIRFESTFANYVAIPSLGDVVGPVSLTTQAFMPWLVAGSMLLVPGTLLWGLLRSHLGQAAVSALAIELRRTHDRQPLTDSLRRALGDRSLQLGLWSRPASQYVTPDGLPLTMPTNGERAVTQLDGDDGPLATMIHDPAVSEQRQLIDGVSAVAQLALENERLHAEAKSHLEYVRASRQRIVTAADEERRRVERNLHDGAQQRLVSLSLALGIAQAKAAIVSPDVATSLAEAEAELKVAIRDLRDLARGIYPAILTGSGLGPALESLANHVTVPVQLETQIDGRLPPIVEATAYFVSAEALTNVAKHASASMVHLSARIEGGWLRLCIADDGVGGADVDGGSGLRGLLDRVAALGGRLTITGGGAAGTRLEAEIPCE